MLSKIWSISPRLSKFRLTMIISTIAKLSWHWSRHSLGCVVQRMVLVRVCRIHVPRNVFNFQRYFDDLQLQSVKNNQKSKNQWKWLTFWQKYFVCLTRRRCVSTLPEFPRRRTLLRTCQRRVDLKKLKKKRCQLLDQKPSQKQKLRRFNMFSSRISTLKWK